MLTRFKSKLAPRNRTITLVRQNVAGCDMAETDLQFFMGDSKNNNCAQNPFLPGGFLCPKGAKCGITKVRGGYSAPLVSDPVFKDADEFVTSLYSDPDRVRKIREHLRIRGFGFDFESKFVLKDDEAEQTSVNETVEEDPAASDSADAEKEKA